MQEKNMGHICPIGRSGVNAQFPDLCDFFYGMTIKHVKIQNTCFF